MPPRKPRASKQPQAASSTPGPASEESLGASAPTNPDVAGEASTSAPSAASGSQTVTGGRNWFEKLQQRASQNKSAVSIAARGKGAASCKGKDKGKGKAPTASQEEGERQEEGDRTDGESEGVAEQGESGRAPKAALARQRKVKPVAPKAPGPRTQGADYHTLWGYVVEFKTHPEGDCFEVKRRAADREKFVVVCKVCKSEVGDRKIAVQQHLGVGSSKSNTGVRHRTNYYKHRQAMANFGLTGDFVQLTNLPGQGGAAVSEEDLAFRVSVLSTFVKGAIPLNKLQHFDEFVRQYTQHRLVLSHLHARNRVVG